MTHSNSPVPEPTPGTSSMIFMLVFGYTCALHVLLSVVAIYLYGDPSAPLFGLTWASLWPGSAQVADSFLYYAAGALTASLAVILPPRMMQAKPVWGQALAANPQAWALVPFMVRHTLFEMCTIVGFIYSFLNSSPFLIVPFAIVGLLGSLATPPTAYNSPGLRSRVDAKR